MRAILDFNKLTQPEMPVLMRDKKQTLFRVKLPTVEIFEKLQKNADILEHISDDHDALEKARALAAILISNNKDLYEISGEEIGDSFGLTAEDLIVFFTEYTAFVKENTQTKN